MSEITVVHPARHASKYWRRYQSYQHAAQDALAPLVLPELARACVAMPIGFIAVHEHLIPVAIQGIEPGRNLLVSQEGAWLATYVPAAYRSYPFVLGASSESEPVLCVIEDSGLLSDSAGEAFYDSPEKLSAATHEVRQFLVRIAGQRQATRRVCQVLRTHGLLQAWPFKHNTEAGERVIEGLYRVDRDALRNLSADKFEAVRQAGALPLIYCHLISLQHMNTLARLALARRAQADDLAVSPDGDLDIEFLNQDDTIRFGAFAQSSTHS